MKKFLAVAMAVAMVATMSAVSFAKNDPSSGKTGAWDEDIKGGISATFDSIPTVKEDDGKYYYPIVNAVGPFSYDSDDKALYNSNANTADANGKTIESGPIEYGETAYFALVQYNTDKDLANNASVDGVSDGKLQLVMDSETVSGLKCKSSWEEGKDLVKSINIVKKKVLNDESGEPSLYYTNDDKNKVYYPTAENLGLLDLGYEKDNKYYYFLAISYESSATTSETDVIGTITLNKSKAPKVDDMEIDVETTIDWANTWRNNQNDYEVTGDNVPALKTETHYALKFNYDDTVEIPFADDSYFEVDVSGQSKLLFYYDTDFNSKVAAKFPLAELNFWNGNGAKFNRVGEFFLDCTDFDGNQFLYQVNSDGTLSEVAGAEYDDADEGFYFNTRVLGSFVISDMELDLSVYAPVAPSTSTPAVNVPSVSNPSTGAIA